MADYINTVDTLGFWKFSKSGDQWNYNSIINSDLGDLKTITCWPQSNGTLILSPNNDFTPQTNGDLESKIYKSRGKALCISEGYGVHLDTKNYGSSMTTEFWFYPKKGTNTSDPTNLNNIISSSSNNAYTDEIWDYTNPQLYSYIIKQGTNGNVNTLKFGGSTTSSTNPIWVYLGYCTYRKNFSLYAYYTISHLTSYNGKTNTAGPITTQLTKVYSTASNFPSDKWYHIAIIQKSGPQVILFINGKKVSTLNIPTTSNTVQYMQYDYSGTPLGANGKTFTSVPLFTPTAQDIYQVCIGNRTQTYTQGDIVEYKVYNSGQYWKQPGFQDVIIDDLRITRGVLYTNDFIPPGFAGYQLLNVDNKVYGYNTAYNFVLMDDNWNLKTNTQKKSTINSLGLVDITLDDIKSVVTPTSSNIHLEVYDLSSGKHKAQLIANYYEETVIPKSLLEINKTDGPLTKLKFTYTLDSSENSIIKVLFTKDLSSYQTYDFTNNQWVNCNIGDISSQGIPIDKVQDISEESLTILGDKFALAYFLHLEPYDENDCSIQKLDIELSIGYGWKHCNQTKANYEYPMINKMKIIFFEDGEFKVNYMDNP